MWPIMVQLVIIIAIDSNIGNAFFLYVYPLYANPIKEPSMKSNIR
ncbi:Uncharacterised protein [Klebsiella pneumoniae]|nr:Uncharacterised protein [Klebsiella pneumoniae]SVJ84786.1 Uncharacterised protein [Klebsiella pneumoniae]SVJ84787.1 Uncharacterised protein [Klebsiella pneumoniae]